MNGVDNANDRLRVGDAERDRATAQLHEHYALGRLTVDELNERLDTTLGAKTVGDLRTVLVDLPPPTPEVDLRTERQSHSPRPAGRTAWGRRHWRPHPWSRGPGFFPFGVIVMVLLIVGAAQMMFFLLPFLMVLWIAVLATRLVRFR